MGVDDTVRGLLSVVAMISSFWYQGCSSYKDVLCETALSIYDTKLRVRFSFTPSVEDNFFPAGPVASHGCLDLCWYVYMIATTVECSLFDNPCPECPGRCSDKGID